VELQKKDNHDLSSSCPHVINKHDSQTRWNLYADQIDLAYSPCCKSPTSPLLEAEDDELITVG
jgi:hypothetical protein